MAADKTGSASKGRGKAGGKPEAPRPAEAHVATALRTAYERDVQEDIPAEFLDLLGKLA